MTDKFDTASAPYFEGIYGMTANPTRQVFMIGLVWRVALDLGGRGIDILEVGSWAGASALTWGQALEIHNEGRGALTCIDAWQPYYAREEIPDDVSQEINAALETNEPYQIFSDNMRFLPPGTDLRVRRGWSTDILPSLAAETYDIVYLDGDHCYAGISADLDSGCRLVRDGGVICGDDLELQGHQVDASIAAQRPKLDKQRDEASGTVFHPGVTLAVAERFGEVSAWNGFWAMRKVADGWQRVNLRGMPAHFPNHLSPKNLTGLKAYLMQHGLI